MDAGAETLRLARKPIAGDASIDELLLTAPRLRYLSEWRTSACTVCADSLDFEMKPTAALDSIRSR